MKPLVSVLIRTKNREKCLRQALQSVEKQTHRPLEVIVVNDGKENIEHVIHSELQHSSVRWIYQQNSPKSGRSAAANKAMSLANAEFLLFLDDDDLVLESHIEMLLNALQKSAPQESLIGVYSGTQCVVEKSGEIVHTDGCYNEGFDPVKLAYQNYLPIHSVLFKKAAYKKGCRFNDSLDIYEDWNFWLQVIQHGSLKHIPKITALYRMNESGVGQPNTNINFHTQWMHFIKCSKPFLSVKQLNHLMFSAKTLSECQTKLTKIQLKKDKHFLEIKHLKKHLRQSQKNSELLEQRLSDQSQKLNEQDQKLNEQDQKLNEQDQKLNEQDQKLNEQDQKLNEQDQKLNEQSQQLIELASLKHQNQMLVDEVSLMKQSWCRKLSQGIKKMKSYLTLESLMKVTKFSYIKAFFALLLKGQFHQVTQKVLRKLKGVRLSRQLPQESLSTFVENGFDILATKHTLYIAELIKASLIKAGKTNVRILDPDPTEFSENLHFVICPQMFPKLPGLYIAFQMEQSVSSRWFTKEYFTILENSYAIMDYSQKNIRFLQEQGGLSYKQMFWAPISNVNTFKPQLAVHVEPTYDVVFYGDINNPRRQEFIKQIKRQFSVLIISEVFGDELYQKLQQGRVVINIHYYENALLETTRLYECLSLGLKVISETSSDIEQHPNLMPYVTFTPINDINAMCKAIQQEITSPAQPPALPDDNENFHYFFTRMLTAVNLLDTQNLQKIPNILTAEDLQQRIVLTLPETYQRHAYIKKQLPNSVFFTGLRHFDGWLGAAMSFKYLSERALAEQVPMLEICEDDVLLDAQFEQNYAIVKRFLFEELGEGEWDVFCGLIADLSDNVTIQNVTEYQGIQFIEMDKMTSMVFNLYNTKALKSLANWDASNRCVETNTIDRYLENQPLKVIVTLPYLVGHQPEHTSSIWHFQNTTYDDLIQKSIVKLQNKVNEFIGKTV